MCKAALPEFRKAGGGTIVNVGSVLGLVAMKDRAAYCASKGGVTSTDEGDGARSRS